MCTFWSPSLKYFLGCNKQWFCKYFKENGCLSCIYIMLVLIRTAELEMHNYKLKVERGMG